MLLFDQQVDLDLPGHQQAQILKYFLGPQLDPEHHPAKLTHSWLLFDRLLGLVSGLLQSPSGAKDCAQLPVQEPRQQALQGL
jgi:hypothetical protein